MAEQTVLVCDGGGARACTRPADSYLVWQPGDKTAARIDLCTTHAKPLTSLLQHAVPHELPRSGRQGMELTPLKTTRATKRLKK